jgi:hypothetical protein
LEQKNLKKLKDKQIVNDKSQGLFRRILSKWSSGLLLGKCSCGKNNQNYKYNMLDHKNRFAHQLEEVKEERDLGVIVSVDLK